MCQLLEFKCPEIDKKSIGTMQVNPIYLLWCTFADSMPTTIRLNICHGCTLVDWVKGKEMDLGNTCSGLQKSIERDPCQH